MTGTTELTFKVRVTTTRGLTEQQINEATEQIVGIVEGLTGPDDDEPVDVRVRSSHAPDPVYTTQGTTRAAHGGAVLDEDTSAWLSQVEARVAAAPPARVDEPGWGYDPEQGAVWTSVVTPDKWTGDASLAQHKICDAHPDAAPFIAHARADLPRAVALIRHLTA